MNFQQYIESLFQRGFGEIRFALMTDENGTVLMQISDPDAGTRYYLTENTITPETLVPGPVVVVPGGGVGPA